MAATLLITAGVNVLPPNDEQLPALCDHIIHALKDSQTATITIQCTRLLLATSPKSATDQEIVRYLLPKLITFVAEDEFHDVGNAVAAVLTTSFIPVLFGDQVQIAMCLFVPMLLERARKGNSKSAPLCAARLLELAQANTGAFKAVVGNLEPQLRTFLEELLKANVASTGASTNRMSVSNQPSIALKMNFGA